MDPDRNSEHKKCPGGDRGCRVEGIRANGFTKIILMSRLDCASCTGSTVLSGLGRRGKKQSRGTFTQLLLALMQFLLLEHHSSLDGHGAA